MLANFSCFYDAICFFLFKINFFQKNLSGTFIIPKCQTVCIKIRTDTPSVLNQIQTVCKGYQQTTLDLEYSKLWTTRDIYTCCCLPLDELKLSKVHLPMKIFVSAFFSHGTQSVDVNEGSDQNLVLQQQKDTKNECLNCEGEQKASA